VFLKHRKTQSDEGNTYITPEQYEDAIKSFHKENEEEDNKLDSEEEAEVQE
jgi:hypothetical protein